MSITYFALSPSWPVSPELTGGWKFFFSPSLLILPASGLSTLYNQFWQCLPICIIWGLLFTVLATFSLGAGGGILMCLLQGDHSKQGYIFTILSMKGHRSVGFCDTVWIHCHGIFEVVSCVFVLLKTKLKLGCIWVFVLLLLAGILFLPFSMKTQIVTWLGLLI